MRILVTGGAGFIGSQFVRSVLRDEYAYLAGAEVTVFDKLTYAGNLDNLADVVDSPRYRFVQGDVCSAADLDAALPGQQLVVNCAAESHVDRSIGGAAREFMLTNVVGAQQVFAGALRHGVQTVVHVSTDEVYGSIDTGSWTEDAPLLPNSPYASSKASGDLVARSYAVTYGLDVRVTRCSNNYGPYQFPEKLIPRFITNLLDGRKVPLYGTGANIRDWVHVSDHCNGLALVAEKGLPGEIYNIGGGRELSNRALTELLIEATGRDWSSVQEIEDPRGAAHDARYSLDSGKAAALGYVPQVPFDQGLAQTVAWYRDNRAWWEPLLPR
ncbi:MAG TPA: dTDP-glucose 4,6-dehydratase [Jatrophihabitans sp.]|nr:dTDP-glucose 4,6-dehydratase [Jatrophihabitans sp.]